MTGRVVVLGFDGATWDLLDLLIQAGKMPNLASIAKRGIRGGLRSVSPPVTAPAWISMATGVNPGRHGCFDFNRPEGSLGSLRPLQTWDIAEKTFYEVLEERGLRTILVNLPGTFPPLTRQVTLTSLLTRGDQAVFPPELRERHPELGAYRIFPDASLRARGESSAYLQDIRAVELARASCIRALWDEPWDTFFAVVSGTDWVSHEAFPALVRGEWDRAPEAVSVFEDADRLLGWIAERLKPEDHLLLVSDHGFRRAHGVLFLNEWLIRKRYALPDFSRPGFPPSHQMEEKAQREALKGSAKLPAALLGASFGFFPARMAAKALRRLGVPWPYSLSVNAGASRAWSLTAEASGITVNEAGRWSDGTVPRTDVLPLVGTLRRQLESLKGPGGEPAFDAVWGREEIYTGIITGEAPHIVLQPGAWGIAAAVRTLPGKPFVLHPMGIHAPAGIFAGFGPAFPSGAESPELSVMDIAPLIFHLNGESIPSDLDGKLLPGLFRKGFLEDRKPVYKEVAAPHRVKGTMDAEEIQSRLRGLGYMG